MNQKTAKIFQWVLGGSAAAAMLSAFFPRESATNGSLLDLLLWPLLIAQLIAACLPWAKYAAKNQDGATAAALTIGFFAVPAVIFMLQLTGYFPTY